MISFIIDRIDNALKIIQNPPIVNEKAYDTSVCIVPDLCPECGACRLCDSPCPDSQFRMRK